MDPIGGRQFARVVAGDTTTDWLHPDIEIRHVSTHSRRIRSGSAFFALSGANADGHRFAAEALRNGAAVVVARSGALNGSSTIDPARVVEVEDPLRALQKLAKWWRTHIEGTIIAVVGSNGKTITKDALAHMLSGERAVYASPGSYNSQLGVALALLACPRDCEVAVLELGFSEPGEMRVLEQMVRPDGAVLVNIGQRWSARFKDRNHQTREMLAVCANLSSDQWLLIGDSDPEIASTAAQLSGCRTYRRGDRSELPVFSEPRYDHNSLDVEVQFPDGRTGRLSVGTPSIEILTDVELAIGAAWLLGKHPSALLAAADTYEPTATRMEIWRSPVGTTLIRDVSTSDPIAVASAIRAAKRVAGGAGRTLVVLDDQLKLGDGAAAGALADLLTDEQVDGVYSTESPVTIAIRDAVGRLERPVPVETFPSRGELSSALLDAFQPGDVALMQSASSIGDLATGLLESMAPTRLYLDLSAIEQNVSTFRRLVGPNVRLMGMVKALAYGTDGIEVARCLETSGMDCLGVSNADEGIALRRAGIALPILVMLGTARDLDKLLRYQLTPVVYSADMLEGVLAAARHQSVPVHVKVDSGMHRTGFSPAESEAVLSRLQAAGRVEIQGLLTHFASADDPTDDEFTARQVARFEQVLNAARGAGLHDVIAHAASTAATIRLPHTHFDMVRVGIGLYGIHPSRATRACTELVPAFALVSRIVEILDVEAGERIGYGGTWHVPVGGARVGVVPAGYGDGVPRDFSNVGHVVVAGSECKIIGRVSMDSITVDLTDCLGAEVGSDVLILGRHGDWLVQPEQLAETIGTIAYELMVRLGPRVQRILTQH